MTGPPGALLEYSRPTAPRGLHASPFVARVLIAGLGTLTLLGLLAGQAKGLKYGFPAGALLVGAVLYRYYHQVYVEYVWWLWFLTPLVRRLVDYRAGYDPLNLIMIAPVGVTALCLLTFVRHLPKLRRKSMVAFAPFLASLVCAYPIGARNNGAFAATYSLLNWVVPLAFGFHLAVNRSEYLSFQRVTRRTFIYGAFALGLYGVCQYVFPAPWDRYWMLNADISTIGRPLPFQVRVFSTLNSPTPFAMVMLAGLLMLLETRPQVHIGVGLPAYLALLLSNVRTAWCAWVIGLGFYTMYLAPRARLRVFGMLGVFAIGLGVLVATPLGERVERRFATFGNLEEDKSLTVRAASSAVVMRMILGQPMGQGLGGLGTASRRLSTNDSITFDNGFLNVFFSLGWGGGLLALGGTLIVLGSMVRRFEPRDDPVPKVARAVGFATFAALSSLNTLTGVSGVIFWGWLGLAISARLWYRDTAALRKSVQLDSHPMDAGVNAPYAVQRFA